jgi:PAT family beta-lactamase induction signal transducer AmpG
MMISPQWFLSDSHRVRYVTGALAYFAQGIPKGLLHIALPAWLAAEGVAPAAIAGYLGVIMLPWAFKLLVGPLMDHYEFLPMGKRRPWVLAMQFGMVASLLGLGLVDDPASQVGLLMALGFVINAFTAAQDVAVDGMSIDLVPLEEEGRLNAFMSFGKAVGWAVASAVTGTLLVLAGTLITGVVCGLGAALIFVFLLLVRERPGERVLPWTPGEAAPQNESPPSFFQVFSDLNHILWSRASLVMMLIMFMAGMFSGYGRALMPIAAVQVFHFTTPQWAELNAIMGFAGAAIALILGPVIDRYGAKSVMGLTMLLTGVHAFTLASTQEMWTNDGYLCS